jgi:Family of unknown function (DUF5703)
MFAMARPPLHTTPSRAGARSSAELEFERITIPREFSRNFVTRLLVDRAERGGWEVDRVRVLHDGTRKVVLRRKIIRQPRPVYV